MNLENIIVENQQEVAQAFSVFNIQLPITLENLSAAILLNKRPEGNPFLEYLTNIIDEVENGFDDENGYDEDGLDIYGFDENGYDEDGYDELGFDEDGFDEDGAHYTNFSEDFLKKLAKKVVGNKATRVAKKEARGGKSRVGNVFNKVVKVAKSIGKKAGKDVKVTDAPYIPAEQKELSPNEQAANTGLQYSAKAPTDTSSVVEETSTQKKSFLDGAKDLLGIGTQVVDTVQAIKDRGNASTDGGSDEGAGNGGGANDAPTEKAKKQKKTLIIVGVVVGALALAGIVYAIVKSSEKAV